MHYLLEAIFVAFYSLIIFNLVYFFFIYLFQFSFMGEPFLFFITGFCKHFFAYFLGIHQYYCRHGWACISHKPISSNKYLDYNSAFAFKNQKWKDWIHLIAWSIGEGIIFIMAYYIFFLAIKGEKKYKYNSIVGLSIFIFFMGFILHILAEWIGLHSYFCHNQCNYSSFMST